MARTVTTLLLFAGVLSVLTLAVSCAPEQDPAAPPPEPAVVAPDAADWDDEESLTDPEGTSDDPFADPDDMSGSDDAPFGDPEGLLGEEFETEGDSASPFDLPDDMWSESGELSEESHGEPSRRPDVHFVPTPQEVVDRMLELAEVTADDVVYDLGCGDGRIVVTAAKRYGAKALGVDIDPQRVAESRKNVKENNVEDLVEIQEADIFEMDLTPASVITLYLLPELNVRLIPQLEKLKPGTRIVSHAFDMRGIKPDKVETVEGEHGTSRTVYFWTTPLQREESAGLDDLF